MASCEEKPDIDLIIGDLPDPLCDDPEFVDCCVIDAQFPEFPTVDSPQPSICTCINEGDDVPTNLLPFDGDPESPTYNPNGPEVTVECIAAEDFEIDVTMVLLNGDCCEPEYEFKIKSTLPCMPTEIINTIGVSDPRVADPEDPKYTAGLDLWFDVTKVCQRFNQLGELIEDNLCEFEIDIKVPPLPKLEVVIKHTGGGIEYIRDCDVDDTKPGVTLDTEWDWNATLQVRKLILTLEIEFQVPMIGRLEDVPETGELDPLYFYKTVDIPTGGDRTDGAAYLVPRAGDAEAPP